MATLDEIKTLKSIDPDIVLGNASTGEQLLEMVSGVAGSTIENIQGRAKARQEEINGQLELFGKLRESGYTKQEASERVNRVFGTGGSSFLEKVVLGKKDKKAFVPPTGESKAEQSRRKTEADITSTLRGPATKAPGDVRSVLDQQFNQIRLRLDNVNKQIDEGVFGEAQNQSLSSERDFLEAAIAHKQGRSLSGVRNGKNMAVFSEVFKMMEEGFTPDQIKTEMRKDGLDPEAYGI